MLIRLSDFSMLFGQCFYSLFPYPVMFSMVYRTYYFEYILKICFADSASSVLSEIAKKKWNKLLLEANDNAQFCALTLDFC